MPYTAEETSDLISLSDEVLAERCSDSDMAVTVLVSRYVKLIFKKARQMALFPLEPEDLAQEGMIGLINAYMSFDGSRNIKFSTYANTCITNKMKDALMKSRSIPQPVSDEMLQDDSSTDVNDSPEAILLRRERFHELCDKAVSLLSDFEWSVFSMFFTGSTYEQIARRLNVSTKTVDNAMQRSRRKLKSLWQTSP